MSGVRKNSLPNAGLLMLCFVAGFILLKIPDYDRHPLLRPHRRPWQWPRRTGHGQRCTGALAK